MRIVLCVCWLAAATPAIAASRPNFVVFLIDDLGWRDIAANNPETFYETPHLDQLAAEGLRFTNGYSTCPVCSPTRYGIMTGKYATRVGATDYFSGKREGRFKPAPLNDWMPREEVTLGEALRAAGYRTAYVGKWHLGPTEEFWPEEQGFEINIAGAQRGSPAGYFSPYRNPRLADGPPGEFLTERLTREAERILERYREEPFLLYYAMYTVHTPLQAPQDLVGKYRRKAAALPAVEEFAPEEQIWPVDEPRRVRIAQRHAVYAAMVETMDAAVGRVLAKLEALGLADNTVVVFTSDNGGLSTSEGAPTSNLPLRAGKGWLYEGGIRTPWIVKWPGVTAAGTTCDVPVISADLYPTILEIAGSSDHGGDIADGKSLAALLQASSTRTRSASEAPSQERALFWHYPHYGNQGGFPGGAIRVGEWKLIERYEDGRVHLYNLAEDVAERNDLAERQPQRVRELRERLHAWYEDVGAQFLESKDGREPWRPE